MEKSNLFHLSFPGSEVKLSAMKKGLLNTAEFNCKREIG